MIQDLMQYSDSELEEMGVAFCKCEVTFIDFDPENRTCMVCEECGASDLVANILNKEQV